MSRQFDLGSVVGPPGPQGPQGGTGPQGPPGDTGNDGVSPTLRAVRSGKTVTIYFTDKNHPGNNEVLAVLYDGEDGTGTGDMRALIYDPTNKAQDIFA